MLAFWTEIQEESKKQFELTKGIAYGLFYGIIGNLFVQFLYPVVESLLLNEFEHQFLWIAIIASVFLVFIIFVSIRLAGELSGQGTRYDKSRAAIGLLESEITQAKYELKKIVAKQKVESSSNKDELR